MGESNSNSTDDAANVRGSLVGSSPDAISQPLGRSSVTHARADVAPTTYIKECRSPMRPPVGERNGFHAARVGVVWGGRRMRYFKVRSPPGATTRHSALSSLVTWTAEPRDSAVRFST